MVASSLDSPVVAFRWIVFAGMTGLMLLWPAYRLSGDRPPRIDPPHAIPSRVPGPVGTALFEWFCLMLVFQIVVWWPQVVVWSLQWLPMPPTGTVSGWSVQQTAWLDGAIAIWSLITAAIVAQGCRSRSPRRRTLAMGLCILLVLGEPLLIALAASGLGQLHPLAAHLWISPIQTPLANVRFPGGMVLASGSAPRDRGRGPGGNRLDFRRGLGS